MIRSKHTDGFEWVIVGAGVHGAYLARELVGLDVDRDDIAVVDRRGEFLGAFEEKARACGMDSLRSTFVQHVGPDPFGLEAFAEGNGRDDELCPTRNHPPRPSLDLFLDHTERVIDRFGLEELLAERTVTGIDRKRGEIVVRTDRGDLLARNAVLAVGPGDRYRRPDWASNVSGVKHVWDSDGRPEDRIDRGDRVWIVGGGVTAGQFATSIGDIAGEVTLCVRGSIREATAEADPRWINWGHIERELHSLPPGSKARYDRVRDVRNEGTMPSYLAREIRGTESVEIRRGEVRRASATDGTVSVLLDGGAVESVDRVVLATGFQPAYDRPLVGAIANSMGLERGYRGMPVLDDATMAWRRRDGTPSRLFVTGRLAECTAGPLAGNIHGARRAAERIVGESAARTAQRV